MTLRLAFAGLAGALALTAVQSPALAQSAAPIGVWQTADRSEMLIIQQNGTCRFTAGQTLIIGNCSWNSSSRGGILTIINQTNYKPAPIYYNVVWINQSTISVYGDVFHRIG